MMKHDYIDKFEITDDYRAGKTVVSLPGRLNKFGMLNFRCEVLNLEKWQNNPLPSHQFGFFLLTTSADIIDLYEAR